MRSVLYRFPDLGELEAIAFDVDETSYELGVPEGTEDLSHGTWVLAVFELGPARRATSAAARVNASGEGLTLQFESRDWERLASFCRSLRAESAPSNKGPDPSEPVRRSRFTLVDEATITEATVLLVDDDPATRSMVTTMLEAVGLRVVAAGSAEEAEQMLVETPIVDLFVLDWNLPGVNGLELCKRLRRSETWTDKPVLFLTGNSNSQDMVEAFASGADDFVMKPFRAPELGARIFALLRRSRHRP